MDFIDERGWLFGHVRSNLVDALVVVLALVVAGIAVVLLGTREHRSWVALGQTRPVGLAAAAFAPSEPPDRSAR